ncbi:Hypothetical protein FNO222_1691 [Francisella orientalis]|uniref:Uncharacterized protein n=1 Tax=Francisella orientalis TaxID=299583 RepID=A0ABM5U8G8_9GAMM|nr:hypothetical protein FNO12_1676 [Francisella orientalis FNO12]AKN87731.1 Hypothetical protein FNO24_1678 [Francisella orientalis FNO24]AKN89269.1 Hypothetical protein FNO190_1676 [Francisella orientalis]AKU06028.1 Hypothetical protein FNO01_1676 [Francisella orientalis]QEN20946.1 Hypothetical protein FNO39_1691 [Francisella orientalis]
MATYFFMSKKYAKSPSTELLYFKINENRKLALLKQFYFLVIDFIKY